MGTLMIIIVVLIFYFVPVMTAAERENKNIASIAVLNIFLGWTVLGWIVALIWAVKNGDKK